MVHGLQGHSEKSLGSVSFLNVTLTDKKLHKNQSRFENLASKLNGM
jgi:hypothetical protein